MPVVRDLGCVRVEKTVGDEKGGFEGEGELAEEAEGASEEGGENVAREDGEGEKEEGEEPHERHFAEFGVGDGEGG